MEHKLHKCWNSDCPIYRLFKITGPNPILMISEEIEVPNNEV